MVGELGGDEDCKNFQSQRGDGEEKVTNIKKFTFIAKLSKI